MAYLLIVMLYPGSAGAFFLMDKTLSIFSKLCSDYQLLEPEKINRLPWYCKFFTKNYIKILIKEVDCDVVRSIVHREYKDKNLDQLINSREFLEALKKKSCFEDNNFFYYY